MTNQIELVARFLDCWEDEDIEGDLSIPDILLVMAGAGIRFAEDDRGDATVAYAASLGVTATSSWAHQLGLSDITSPDPREKP